MSFFESSARIPLLIHHPASFPAARISHPVSALDILPTLTALVDAPLHPDLPLDGKSLKPFLLPETSSTPHPPPAPVFAEYTGEGTIAPLVMIRRGAWKYVACPNDPPQLFHLPSDPHELHNLALPEHRGLGVVDPEGPGSRIFIGPRLDALVAEFAAEVALRWDFVRIDAEVRRSQRQRRLIWQALRQGRFTSWDYEPPSEEKDK